MAVEVSIDQLKQARQEGAIVVDVRNDDEYAAGHVSGAQSLPLPEVEARMHELPKDQTVFLVCQGGGRSGKAADLLGAAGYDVRSVAGGTSAWLEAGGETTPGTDRG
ncbi:MAG: rhodanese-like domain-containing protein [Frankiales bacterium]|nr:rhodanese-like domain-containing protein [Frankiales bacterium]